MDNEKVTIDWGGTRGAAWTVAGGVLGLLAQRSGLLGGNGLLGGTPCDVATQRDLGYERELTKANAEIGQLKAEKYADAGILAAERRLADKIERVEASLNTATTTQAVLNAKQEAFIGGLAAQVASFDRMTARYINPVVMNVSEAAAKALPKPAPANGTGS